MSIIEDIELLCNQREETMKNLGAFVAPIFHYTKKVSVLKGNFVYHFKLKHKVRKEGFYLLSRETRKSSNTAHVLSEAGELDRKNYLKPFPTVIGHVLEVSGNNLLIRTREEDGNKIEIVKLGEADLLDEIIGSVVGNEIIFKDIINENKRITSYLTTCLTELKKPEEIEIEIPNRYKDIYSFLYETMVRTKEKTEEQKLKERIDACNASLISIGHSGDNYVLSIDVDGTRFDPVVSKNLQIQSAGFCLEDLDKEHDITSFISVAREKNRQDFY